MRTNSKSTQRGYHENICAVYCVDATGQSGIGSPEDARYRRGPLTHCGCGRLRRCGFTGRYSVCIRSSWLAMRGSRASDTTPIGAASHRPLLGLRSGLRGRNGYEHRTVAVALYRADKRADTPDARRPHRAFQDDELTSATCGRGRSAITPSPGVTPTCGASQTATISTS